MRSVVGATDGCGCGSNVATTFSLHCKLAGKAQEVVICLHGGKLAVWYAQGIDSAWVGTCARGLQAEIQKHERSRFQTFVELLISATKLLVLGH